MLLRVRSVVRSVCGGVGVCPCVRACMFVCACVCVWGCGGVGVGVCVGGCGGVVCDCCTFPIQRKTYHDLLESVPMLGQLEVSTHCPLDSVMVTINIT